MFDGPHSQRKPFMLDRFGAGPMVMIPRYQAINEVPLPCIRNKQGMIISLMRCFNCGSKDHNLRDCKIKRDRECVQMNKCWMQEYARIGVKKSREHEVHSRYFIQNEPDSKGDKSLTQYKQTPSNDQSADKPPDLQIITEDTELLTPPPPPSTRNRRQNSQHLEKSYGNNHYPHNGRGNNYNGRSNYTNNNSRREHEGQHYDRSQHHNSRPRQYNEPPPGPRQYNGPPPGPRRGSHYGPRPHRSRRNQFPYQRQPLQSGRWRGGRDARARN